MNFVNIGERTNITGSARFKKLIKADDYEAALDVAELGMSEAEIGELAEELEVGDALLLLVIENVWAVGLADALREAGIVFAQQDYLSPGGLVALGAMLGLEVDLDGCGRDRRRRSGMHPACMGGA